MDDRSMGSMGDFGVNRLISKLMPWQSWTSWKLMGNLTIGLTLGWSALSLGTIAQISPPEGTIASPCQDRQNNLVREWIERSRTLIQSQNPEAAAQALLRVVKVMGPSPSSQMRMETLRSLLEETPTGILTTFVELSMGQQQPQAALRVLPVLLEMARSLPTAYSAVKTQALTTIAKHYLTLGDAAQARGILDQATTAATFLQGAEFQTKALTSLAQGYEALGDQATAVKLLGQSMEFVEQVQHPNPIRQSGLWEPIALTYANLGRSEEALAVVERFRRQDPSLQSYGNETIARVVRADAQANQWDRALARLSQVNDLTLRGRVLAELAGQRFKAGQLPAAQKLLAQAMDTAQQESSEGLQNNALVNVLRTYGETTGRVTEVLPLVNTLKDPAAQATLLSALAGLVPVEPVNSNPADLNPADPNPTDPNPSPVDLLNQGLTTAQNIEDPYQRSSLIGQLLQQHFEARRWAIVLPLIQSLPKEDPFTDPNSWLNLVVTEAANTGDWSASLAALELLPEQWDDYRNSGLQRIAVGYAREGNFATALDLLTRITNNGSYPYQVRTLAALAEQARLQGDISRSQALLTQAQEITQNLTFESQKADALIALAIPFHKLGQHTLAQQLQGQALQLLEGDPSMMGYQLQEMIKQYLESEDYNGAVQLALSMPNLQEEQSWILNNLAEKLIEANALDIALTATNRIEKPEDKARFLLTLGGYYLFDGNISAVTTTLDQALITAQGIPDPESRQLVFRTPPDQTIVEDPYDRASTLETIALNYANIGELNKARGVVEQLQDPALRQSLFQQLTCYPETQ